LQSVDSECAGCVIELRKKAIVEADGLALPEGNTETEKKRGAAGWPPDSHRY